MFHGYSHFTITSSQLAINHITGLSSGKPRRRDNFLYHLYPNAILGIDMLYHESNHEAAYDSSARDLPPRCRPGTRDRHIENTLSWALALINETPLHLIWVEGAERVKKTAVAQTCVEKLKTVGTPLGAFFFSKRTSRHQQFFPTIAYQLSTEFPEYQTLLDAKICRNRSLLYHKTMASQFKGLILEPFQELERAGKKAPTEGFRHLSTLWTSVTVSLHSHRLLSLSLLPQKIGLMPSAGSSSPAQKHMLKQCSPESTLRPAASRSFYPNYVKTTLRQFRTRVCNLVS
jgi:hypothetical protein